MVGHIEQPLPNRAIPACSSGSVTRPTEDFVFTEADRHLSGGSNSLVTSVAIGRPARVADVVRTLGRSPHYLATGGIGFLIGDGRSAATSETYRDLLPVWQVPHWPRQISPPSNTSKPWLK